MIPDYKNYTISELSEARHGLNVELYPETEELLIAEIERRAKAGFVLSGEKYSTPEREREIPFYGVALPAWWCFIWRSTVAGILFSAATTLVLSIVLGFIGVENEYLQPVAIAIHVIAFPYIGIYFMRQALVKSYSSFQIEVFLKNG